MSRGAYEPKGLSSLVRLRPDELSKHYAEELRANRGQIAELSAQLTEALKNANYANEAYETLRAENKRLLAEIDHLRRQREGKG